MKIIGSLQEELVRYHKVCEELPRLREQVEELSDTPQGLKPRSF